MNILEIFRALFPELAEPEPTDNDANAEDQAETPATDDPEDPAEVTQ